MDVNKLTKIIAEEAFVGHNPETFMLAFRHGENGSAFVLSPAGAKAFAENLANHVKEYESSVGPIDTSGMNTNIVSPIQKGD